MPKKVTDIEEEILKYWEEHRVFEKSLEKPAPKGDFVFYDGPPFATGLPHYGHIVASLMKDVVPRYFTMRGYRVERKWGWDCHGLPIENIVEKELGTKSKKEIEEMGVAKFNELCRSKVLSYVEDWKKTIRRLGRWVDMQNAYHTMDRDYMESVWWVFKQLWDKNLIYEDYRSMHICPRCETTLSQQEVSEGYKEVKDISVTVKFKLTRNRHPFDKLRAGSEVTPKDPVHPENHGILRSAQNDNIFLLAWTTTPWTLPGNVALAVGPEIEYVVVRSPSPQPSPTRGEGEKRVSSPSMGEDKGGGEYFILAKARLSILSEKYEIVQEMKGKELVGLKYEPLFPYYKDTKNAFRVVAGDFVTTEDGTGIVHIAPAYGDDDFKVGKREKIPMVQHVGMDGRFKSEVLDFAGMEVKPKADDDRVRLGADIAIIKYLQDHGSFFTKQNITHTYPHCWRCDTPLLNYATSSWFVKVINIKSKALKLAQKINWSPEHIKEGRFGKWLEGARDWSISRQRFWASVMPVWQCIGKNGTHNMEHGSCRNTVVFGSVMELEKVSGKVVADLHKHVVDEIVFPCEKCGGQMRRIPDVLDTWFDSGSMPYAQVHYPFENKEKFEASFPAEFIAEGQDQTRAWFYYLHVLGTALFGKRAFSNVIVNGIVLAEDGKKMAKKLQNYPDPNVLLNTYGADALRYYLVTSPVMSAENLNFSEAGVREAYNKVVSMLVNVLEFYKLYAPTHSRHSERSEESRDSQDGRDPFDGLRAGSSALPQDDMSERMPSCKNVLDRWILARLHELIQEVTGHMEAYRLAEASRPIMDFVADLSQWYLRRSRDRFKGKKSEQKAALNTTAYVLHTLSQVLAPFMPFLAEHVYQNVVRGFSLAKSDPEGSHYEDIKSVHLTDWPKFQVRRIDRALLEEMTTARKVVELAHAARAEAKIKVRQPLSELRIKNEELRIEGELLKLIAEEVNVKSVAIDPSPQSSPTQRTRAELGAGQARGEEGRRTGEGWITKTDGSLTVSLNTELTTELEKEGLLRELTRQLNDARKNAGLTPSDRVEIMIATSPHSASGHPLPEGEGRMREVIKDFQKLLRKAVLARVVKLVEAPKDTEWSGEIEIEGQGKMWVGIIKS